MSEVIPADLAFKLVLNKQLLTTFTIKNSNDHRLAFKVRTTAPQKYAVRPGAGIIDPNSAVIIQVIMQAQSQCSAVSADKFKVQMCVLGDNEQIEEDTFPKKGGKGLEVAVLRVRWEDPDSSAAIGIPVSAGTLEVKGLIGKLQHENDELRKQLDQLQSARNDELRKQLDQLQSARRESACCIVS